MNEEKQIDELVQRRVRLAIGDLVLQLQTAQAVIEHLQARVTELERPHPEHKINGSGAPMDRDQELSGMPGR